MKRNSFVKVRLTIRRLKDSDLLDTARFLSNVRWRFAFRNLVELAGTRYINDNFDYEVCKYDVIVERPELFALKHYIDDIKEYVNFEVEIEELS